MAFDKKQIIQDAAEGFHISTGLTVRADPTVPMSGIDGLIRISKGEKHWKLEAEVLLHLTVTRLGLRGMRGRRTENEKILVTDFAAPALADFLKQTNTSFIDTAGNAYLNLPGLYLFIKGNKRPRPAEGAERNRAFTRSGLRTIFSLLVHPGLENRSYRDIAHAAGVALGTIDLTMRGLRTERFLIEMGHNSRRLRLRKTLLEEWVSAYPRDLRPKAYIGRYTSSRTDWWNDPSPGTEGSLWGGEIAAARIVQDFQPGSATVYIHGTPGELIGRHGLTRDPAGNVELLQTFWRNDPTSHTTSTVHPLLVYADLIATGDPKNITASQKIFETYLAAHLTDD